MARCGICHTEDWNQDELKHLDIYVNGSEGVYICPDCETGLTNHLRSVRSAAARGKAVSFKRKAKKALT